MNCNLEFVRKAEFIDFLTRGNCHALNAFE